MTRSFRDTALRGAHLASAGWALTQALNFAAYLVLARLISPASFGHFAEASVVTGVGALFAESGMMAALIHRNDRLDEAASTAAVATFLTGLVLCPAAAATAPLLGLLFHSGEVTALALALSGWLLLRALTVVPDALLQRRFSFLRRVVVEPLGVAAFAVTSIVLASHGHGAWALVAGTYAAMTAQVVSAWAFVRWRPRLHLASIAMWRELVGYARHVFASELLRRSASQVDVLSLGSVASAGAVGQYRNGLRLARQPHDGWVQVAAYVLLPTFARMRDDPVRFRAAVQQTTATMFMVVAPLVAMLVAVGHPATMLALGRQWSEAGYVVMALAGFVAGGTFVSLASEVLKAAGRPQLLVRTHVATLLTTCACVPALAWLGPVGAALGVSLSTVLTAGYVAWLLRAAVAIRWGAIARAAFHPYAAAAGAAVVSFAIGGRLEPESADNVTAGAAVLAMVAAGSVTYLALLRVLDPTSMARLRALVPGSTQDADASPTGATT
ncbi:MAG: putative polysaccharide biosynthesis protein [Solirubrobacterales bacterium]|nr:putative polysaccharide biosynthesis protein [Solirubrobacterales bacterium]